MHNYMSMQMGDVPANWADVLLRKSLTRHRQKTRVKDGVAHLIAWPRLLS